MCYSAKVRQDHQDYERLFGVHISLSDYVRLYAERAEGINHKIPKGMDLQFQRPKTPEELQILASIQHWQQARSHELQSELFAQRTRLADSERKLAVKVTKAAQESQRIASSKVRWLTEKLADLRREQPEEDDSRIYPGDFVPVVVIEDGRRVLKPMRYLCRPPGVPASFDRKYPGTYNARRDSLTGYWRRCFGHTHGVIILGAFFEHVERKLPDGTSEKAILRFEPDFHRDMLCAAIWSHWTNGDEQLHSVALITDEPPPEVSAAGHDRCVIPLKSENVDAWLNPQLHSESELQRILDDRERPYYEHRLAA